MSRMGQLRVLPGRALKPLWAVGIIDGDDKASARGQVLERMRKTATTIRCVPRFGFENTEVRVVDLNLPREAEEQELYEALRYWFSSRGFAEAVYGFDVDDNGFFAIINDEVYKEQWGKPLL